MKLTKDKVSSTIRLDAFQASGAARMKRHKAVKPLNSGLRACDGSCTNQDFSGEYPTFSYTSIPLCG
jgi:hypothetical protein